MMHLLIKGDIHDARIALWRRDIHWVSMTMRQPMLGPDETPLTTVSVDRAFESAVQRWYAAEPNSPSKTLTGDFPRGTLLHFR
ncbi:MAG: hypothetical protein ABW034_16995 [Steroidobacteraceae bacterium]